MTFRQEQNYYVFVINAWSPTVATDEVWGRNLRTAKRAFEEKHDVSLTYKLIGEKVATAMGRPRPFGHSTVLNWFENGQEPEGFPVLRALAGVLETTVETLLTRPTPADSAEVNQEGATPPKDLSAEQRGAIEHGLRETLPSRKRSKKAKRSKRGA